MTAGGLTVLAAALALVVGHPPPHDLAWIGRAVGGREQDKAVITFGAEAVFGTIALIFGSIAGGVLVLGEGQNDAVAIMGGGAWLTATMIAAIVLVLTCFMRRSTPTELTRVGDDAAR